MNIRCEDRGGLDKRSAVTCPGSRRSIDPCDVLRSRGSDADRRLCPDVSVLATANSPVVVAQRGEVK
jgi:hypothetical protein